MSKNFIDNKLAYAVLLEQSKTKYNLNVSHCGSTTTGKTDCWATLLECGMAGGVEVLDC